MMEWGLVGKSWVEKSGQVAVSQKRKNRLRFLGIVRRRFQNAIPYPPTPVAPPTPFVRRVLCEPVMPGGLCIGNV